MAEKISIICEIGMNHMGNAAYADEYIAALLASKPDGVTFQVREKGYAKQLPGGPLYLSDDYYRSAAARLREGGIEFGVGLCDPERAAFFEEIGTDFYKVLSKDIGNMELLHAILETGKPVYVSTGMSDEEEIGAFLKNLGSTPPQLSLIHTQLSYEDADTNLRAIARLRDVFGVPVAFGSHSTDANALYTALGFEPKAVIFYVRGDREVVHGDQDHAVPLSEAGEVISNIRRLETMLGDGVKRKMENRIAAQKK